MQQTLSHRTQMQQTLSQQPKIVIPTGAEQLFLPSSLRRRCCSAQWRNLSSIARVDDCSLATISLNVPRPVIPSGVARLFPPRLFLRTSRATQSRNLSSIYRVDDCSLATISLNVPRPVIPSGVARPFPPRSFLRTSRATQSRNLSSIYRGAKFRLIPSPRSRKQPQCPLP
jgi:hypothetical protein